ncbi:MAG: hypothetical protein MRERC_3c153 [Mycoplasmataceae bacterium RC_NB112A]|nr:MAG: hypothetical protein MRERC_3c153 [Mycoplasmataceae bacterium RC_NB112A]
MNIFSVIHNFYYNYILELVYFFELPRFFTPYRYFLKKVYKNT